MGETRYRILLPATVSASPLPADFVARMRANRALFPRGVDIILASVAKLAALPRSVHVA